MPDGINHTKGFVKDQDEAQRYLTLTETDPQKQLGTDMDVDQILPEKAEDRKKSDLNKNVASFLGFELFSLPLSYFANYLMRY